MTDKDYSGFSTRSRCGGGGWPGAKRDAAVDAMKDPQESGTWATAIGIAAICGALAVTAPFLAAGRSGR
jgi:hypothetical protein